MNECVVRYEKNSIIIWSPKNKAYYCAKLKEDVEELGKVLKGEVTKGKIYDELRDIGIIDLPKRFLYSKTTNDLMSPLEYYFDFTNVCNLRCSHCYNRENMNSNTLSQEQIEKIITDMYNSGVMRLHLAGGEPTLFPKELDTYLSTANKFGIVTSMASNGINITDEVCEILSKNNLMSITISIESANEEKNAKIRGKGNLNKALEGIKKLQDYKKKHNSPYIIGIKVSYDTNMSEVDFEELIKLAIEYNIDILKFANPERCVFHEKGFYSAIVAKYYDNIQTIKKLIEKYKNKIFITQIASPVNACPSLGIPNMKGCIGAQELIAINCKGEINPCLMNPTPLGNILEMKSIKELYSSELLQEYYKKIKNYDCSSCESHSQCRGGCQVRKIVEYGEIVGIDPNCPLKNNQHVLQPNTDDNKMIKICVLHSL